MLTNLTNVEVVVVTLSKLCISRARINLQKPKLENVLRSLTLETTKEYKIAKAHNKLDAVDKKWGRLTGLLN